MIWGVFPVPNPFVFEAATLFIVRIFSIPNLVGFRCTSSIMFESGPTPTHHTTQVPPPGLCRRRHRWEVDVLHLCDAQWRRNRACADAARPQGFAKCPVCCAGESEEVVRVAMASRPLTLPSGKFRMHPLGR